MLRRTTKPRAASLVAIVCDFVSSVECEMSWMLRVLWAYIVVELGRAWRYLHTKLTLWVLNSVSDSISKQGSMQSVDLHLN
jgi:hypothetical protein